jgi:hypothetical protein
MPVNKRVLPPVAEQTLTPAPGRLYELQKLLKPATEMPSEDTLVLMALAVQKGE